MDRELFVGAIRGRGMAHMNDVRRLGVPVVNVWMSSPAAEGLPGVFPDFAAGGKLVADHLVGRGFRFLAARTLNDRFHRALAMSPREFRKRDRG